MLFLNAEKMGTWKMFLVFNIYECDLQKLAAGVICVTVHFLLACSGRWAV